MEILTNIWNVLTTENETIIRIIDAFSVVVEVSLLFYLSTSILKIPYKKKHALLYITFLSLSSFITKYIIPEPINIFINYFIMFIIIKTILKTNLIKTILSVIIPTIVFALISSLILNPFLKLFGITYYHTSKIPVYRFVYLCTLYILILLTLLVIKLKKLKFNIISEISVTNRNLILLNLILGFVILCIQAILTVYYVTIVPLIITILNFIVLFVYFFISFYSLSRTMKLQLTTQDLETAENYNNTLCYLYDNVKAFQHDFNNMVFIMGGFIQDNDIEGLKKYYKSLENDCNKVNNITLLNPTLINNSGIYNLLMSKYKKAANDNVTIHLEYFFDFNKLNMPIYDFSRILGILLDNAIEAAKETKDKQVNIMFRDSSRNHTQIINIENTYLNKKIDIKKIFEKGESSKENHSGVGLWEVNQILKRNNNVNLITTNNEIYFKQSLEIYY